MRHEATCSTKLWRVRFLVGMPAISALVVAAACATVTGVGTDLGVRSGAMTERQAAAATQTAERADAVFGGFTPEQEYYIGRAVGAQIMAQYEPYDDPAANEYLNLVGQSLALASTRPELFDGYRFLILDSDEINAFATPSGLVMVTRGALRLTDSEDGVAAILAHEIGHVERRHGISAIRTARITGEVGRMLSSGAERLTGAELARLTKAFEGCIDDVTTTLVNSGYSQAAEREADQAAVRILRTVGYDPRALVGVLQSMDREIEPRGRGFGSTHPSPSTRIGIATRAIGGHRSPEEAPSARQERYERALGSI